MRRILTESPGRELLSSEHIFDAAAPNSCLWIICIKITKMSKAMSNEKQVIPIWIEIIVFRRSKANLLMTHIGICCMSASCSLSRIRMHLMMTCFYETDFAA